MSETEVAPLPGVLALLALGAPFLWLAMRRMARRLPARPAVEDRWSGSEALAVLALPILLLALVGALLEPADEDAAFDPLLALVASQAILAGGGLLACGLAWRRPNGRAGLGLAQPWPRAAGGALLVAYGPLFFVLIGTAGLWAHVCRTRGIEVQQEVMEQILALESGALLVAMLLAVLVGPFLEELFFRGFLQPCLGQYMSMPAAVVLSSALFASLHGLVGVPIFGLSLVLGWLQARTRCLWVPWSLHALHNGVTLTLALALQTR